MTEPFDWMDTGDPEDGFAQWLEAWRAKMFGDTPLDSATLFGRPIEERDDLIEEWAKEFLSARLGLPRAIIDNGPVIYMRFPTRGGE